MLKAPKTSVIPAFAQRFDNDQNLATPDPYAGDYFFYNYDCRGSTSSVIAPNGTLTTGYAYDEFGKQTLSGATDFLNEVTFTGSVSDTSSGLQYMNARFYNPSTGRFLSQDTYSGNAYDPWTQHLYAYCGNNPVNMIDPTGHEFTASQSEDMLFAGRNMFSAQVQANSSYSAKQIDQLYWAMSAKNHSTGDAELSS